MVDLKSGMIKDSDLNKIPLELVSDFTYLYSHNFSHDNNFATDYKLEMITDSFFNITGYNKEDLNFHQGWMGTVHPEDQQIVQKQLAIAKKRSVDAVEFRILDRNGDIIWIKNYVYCLRDEDDYGAAKDITDFKNSEKEANDMVEFLQTLADTIPSSIFYKDNSGKYMGCNKEYAEFLGLKKDEISDKGVYEIFHKYLADKYHKMDSELFKNPGKQFYDWKMTHADNTAHDIIFNKATYLNSEGDLAGLVGAMLDITDFKNAENNQKKVKKNTDFWLRTHLM